MKVGQLVIPCYQEHRDPWSGETTNTFLRSYNEYPPKDAVGIILKLLPFDVCEIMFEGTTYKLHRDDVKKIEMF